MSVTVCLDEPVTAECTCLRLLVYIHVYSTRMLVLWLHVYNMCHCLCQFDPLHTCSPCYGMSSRYVSTHVCILVWYAMCVWNISTDVKLVPDVFDFDFKEVYQCLQGVPGALMRPVVTKHSSVACDIDGDAHRRTCITCPCRGGKRLNPRTSMSSFLHPVIFWTWFVKTWMIKNLYFGLHNSGLWCKFSDIFWKGMPICHTYLGFFPGVSWSFSWRTFFSPMRFTFVSRTLSACNPKSMWDRLRAVLWTAKAVAPESTFNLNMTNLSKLNLHYVLAWSPQSLCLGSSSSSCSSSKLSMPRTCMNSRMATSFDTTH